MRERRALHAMHGACSAVATPVQVAELVKAAEKRARDGCEPRDEASRIAVPKLPGGAALGAPQPRVHPLPAPATRARSLTLPAYTLRVPRLRRPLLPYSACVQVAALRPCRRCLSR